MVCDGGDGPGHCPRPLATWVPAPEICRTGPERRHGFEAGLAEFRRLEAALPALGQEVARLPKAPVAADTDFVPAARGCRHFAPDSFTGLPAPDATVDNPYFREGDYGSRPESGVSSIDFAATSWSASCGTSSKSCLVSSARPWEGSRPTRRLP